MLAAVPVSRVQSAPQSRLIGEQPSRTVRPGSRVASTKATLLGQAGFLH